MLAVVAMASCSKSELTTRPEVAGDVEIKAGSTALSIDTKAPYIDDLTQNGDELTAYVYAGVETSGAVDYKAASTQSGYMHFENASGTVAAVGFSKWNTTPALEPDPKYYPTNGDALQMVAVYPAESTATWSTASTTSDEISATIDGKTDLMAAQVATMDATTDKINKTNAAAGKNPKFDFKHLLTLVNVKVYVGETDATKAAKIIDAFGKIKKITLKGVNDGSTGYTAGVNPTCKVALNTLKADMSAGVTFDGALTTLPFYKLTEDASNNKVYADDELNGTAYEVTLTTTSTYAAYAIIPPFTAKTTNNIELEVETENGGKHKVEIGDLKDSSSASIANTSTQGKSLDVVLKFMAEEIEASAKVSEWDDITTDEIEIK